MGGTRQITAPGGMLSCASWQAWLVAQCGSVHAEASFTAYSRMCLRLSYAHSSCEPHWWDRKE